MWRAALVVAIVLVGVACSGDDDAVPPTSASVTTPPTSEMTAVPTSAGDVATTAPPPSTSGDSTVETAPPETSTSDPTPLTADEQAVVDAVVASWTAWNDVLLDPFDDARIERIALTHTSGALQRVVDVVASRRLENRRSLTNPEFPAFIDPDEQSVRLDLENGTAEIEYCHLDSNIAVEIGGNDDGTDRVLDESIAIRFERETFELVDGSWLKSGGASIGATEGETVCPQ